jgi:hypothetical protein
VPGTGAWPECSPEEIIKNESGGEGSTVREIKIFSGNANIALAQEMVSYLKTSLGAATVGAFSDGEILKP